MQASTIATTFDPRRNSLNAIRLVLALLVVVSHAWPLNGFEGEPALGGLTLGSWAVVGFFAISGFLITRSRIRARQTADFWIARLLRIFPGAIVALIVVAFVLAPIGVVLQPGASWDAGSATMFVLRNAMLYPPGISQAGIDRTLVGFRFHEWDGPLWTLFWEASCYVFIGAAVSLVRSKKWLSSLIAASLVASTAFLLYHDLTGRGQDLPVRVLPMIAAFAAGTLLALHAGRVPVRKVSVGVAAALLFAGVALGAANALAAVPFAFLLLLLSNYAPLSGVGSTYDVSYGVYIYAWPVQQLVVLSGLTSGGPVVGTIAVVIVLTLPLAFLSCRFVEKPALSLKRNRHAAKSSTWKTEPGVG